MKVLVTGATGLLGRSVVAELVRRGHKVRALVRPATRVEALCWDPQDVEVFRADLRGATDLAPAFDAVDVLVHLAAAVTGGEDLQFASTVVGTERLLEAMQRSPTTSLVLASSLSVYDWRRVGRKLSEVSPVEQDMYERDGYAIAKIWQERLARRVCKENGWRLVVMRPGFIWGRENAFVAGLGQAMGPAHVIVAPLAHLPLTHVVNCADAFVSATEKVQVADGLTFNVVDGHAITSWEYAGRYLRARGGGFRVPLPYQAGLLLVRLVQSASKLIFRGKGRLPSLFMPVRFQARFRPVECDCKQLRDVLGWSPPLALEDCLQQTFGAAGATPVSGAGAVAGRVDAKLGS